MVAVYQKCMSLTFPTSQRGFGSSSTEQSHTQVAADGRMGAFVGSVIDGDRPAFAETGRGLVAPSLDAECRCKGATYTVRLAVRSGTATQATRLRCDHSACEMDSRTDAAAKHSPTLRRRRVAIKLSSTSIGTAVVVFPTYSDHWLPTYGSLNSVPESATIATRQKHRFRIQGVARYALRCVAEGGPYVLQRRAPLMIPIIVDSVGRLCVAAAFKVRFHASQVRGRCAHRGQNPRMARNSQRRRK